MINKLKLPRTAIIAIIAVLAVAIGLLVGLLVRGCQSSAAPIVKPADTVITTVAITVTGPATGDIPAAAAETNDSGYTCGEVSWSPDHATFWGGTVYTATVTLTAHDNHTFSRRLTAEINNREAKISGNHGKTATVSLQFDATYGKAVTGISIEAQPAKLGYIHGNTLDLRGLVITLVYEDDETEEVTPNRFASRNIRTNPANGMALSYSAHNGNPIVVSCGRVTVQTDNLSIRKAVPIVMWPTGLTANFGQTLSDISLGAYDNGGAGAFNWAAPGDSVGALGTQAHNMTFTPIDTDNYYTVTDDVEIKVLLGVTLASVPTGTFTMGSPSAETGRYSDETQWPVTVRGFYMEQYEVTQGQYETVMGKNPSNFKTDANEGENQKRRPVESVSWYDTLVFCNRLSMLEGFTPAYRIGGKTNPDEWGPIPTGDDAVWNDVEIVAGTDGYRLPTEAQWEYACRAGTKTAYNTGDMINDDTGWYISNSNGKTHEVGLKPPNAWGLYDMYGNVYEWCWDWYGPYPTGAQTDPMGASSGPGRVIRGGGWNGSGQIIRSAYRGYPSPYTRATFLGFRLVRPVR